MEAVVGDAVAPLQAQAREVFREPLHPDICEEGAIFQVQRFYRRRQPRYSDVRDASTAREREELKASHLGDRFQVDVRDLRRAKVESPETVEPRYDRPLLQSAIRATQRIGVLLASTTG